jgi:hypothetical protein
MIFEIAEFTLTKAELKAIPSEHRDFLFISEIAIYDLVLLNNLTAMCGNIQDSNDIVQTYITSRWFSIIKHTSAKIHEFVAAYRIYQNKLGKYSKTKKPKDFDLNAISNSDYYQISKVIRNNFVFHYGQQNYEKYFGEFDDEQEFTSYLAVATGNGLHSIGDCLSIFGPLRDHFREEYSKMVSDKELKDTYRKHVNEYVSWCVACVGLISAWQQDFMIWLFDNYFPERKIPLKRHEIEKRLTYNPTNYFIPIFARVDAEGEGSEADRELHAARAASTEG